MADDGHASVDEAVRWLVGQLTAPKRISEVISAWMAAMSTTDPPAKTARLELILQARRVLKVPAHPGADEHM